MHRNKIPFLLLIFLFASLFVIGFIPSVQHFPKSKIFSALSQAGLALSLILFFLVPAKRKREEND